MPAQRSIVICGGAFAGLALALALRQGLGPDIPVMVADPALGLRPSRDPRATAIVANTRIFTLAESLGGVESLIEVPQAMTHQSVEGSSAAVPSDLVRLSCGVEAANDLVEDLRQAIQASAATADA